MTDPLYTEADVFSPYVLLSRDHGHTIAAHLATTTLPADVHEARHALETSLTIPDYHCDDAPSGPRQRTAVALLAGVVVALVFAIAGYGIAWALGVRL